jgi:integral membrane protein
VLEILRKVALVEGVTTLALFLVAMPLKYLAGWPALVPPVGWAHGIAFIVYVFVMAVAFVRHRVGALGWLRTGAAALLPFGTFVNDPWLRRLQARPSGGSVRQPR